MSNAPEKSGEERRGGLSDALAAQLDSDARFGSGVSRELTEAERLRIQTAGAARPAAAPASAAPVEGEEGWAAPLPVKEAVRRPETPRAPGLEEAEQFLRELEAQPREMPGEEAEPGSEVAF